jgi:CDP-diacylglycerol--serine O-phosphatidyltransferase
VGTFGSLLPSLLTTCNLAAGFFAIVRASIGDPLTASYAIFVAAVFDMLDGRAARLIEMKWAGWVMAFVYTACGSLRLARFNVSSGRYRDRFDGLPTPAAAGMVVSTVWFGGFLQDHGLGFSLPPFVAAAGLVLLGLMMVSPVPYRTFKEVNVRGSYSATVLMVIVTLVLILEPGVSFFAIGLAYVLSGPLAWWWRRRTGRLLEAAGGEAGAAENVTSAPGVQENPDEQTPEPTRGTDE